MSSLAKLGQFPVCRKTDTRMLVRNDYETIKKTLKPVMWKNQKKVTEIPNSILPIYNFRTHKFIRNGFIDILMFFNSMPSSEFEPTYS